MSSKLLYKALRPILAMSAAVEVQAVVQLQQVG